MSETKFSLKIDKDRIKEVCNLKLEKKIRLLEKETKAAIRSPIFLYAGSTRRKNGTIAGQIRDGVDTGRLVRSVQAVFWKSGTGAILIRTKYARKIISKYPGNFTEYILERIRKS